MTFPYPANVHRSLTGSILAAVQVTQYVWNFCSLKPNSETQATMKKKTENLTHSLDLRVKSHETLASIKDRKLYEASFFFSAKGRFTLLLTPQIYSLFMRSVKKKQSAIVNVYVYYRALLRTMKWKNGRGLGRVALDILQALSTRPDSNLLAFALPLLSRRLLTVWMGW